jgi:hypothetical protein
VGGKWGKRKERGESDEVWILKGWKRETGGIIKIKNDNGVVMNGRPDEMKWTKKWRKKR